MNQIADFFAKLLNTADWPPRWHCGKWSDFHGWLYIISDLLIWSAYFAIPIVILRYILKKEQIRFERLYLLFAAFILACGATHLLDAVAFWVPLYRLSALVRFVTGVISWITVYYLVKLLPVIFSMKSQDVLEAEILHRQRAENRFKLLLEATPDALIIADKNGVITLVNWQAEKLFGYSKEELTGKSLDTLMPESYKKGYTPYLNNFFLKSDTVQADNRIEIQGLQQNGNLFSAEVHVSTIQLEDGLYLCAAIRDLSERKKQEKEFNEMAVIIASSSDAIISESLDGTILTWNKGAEKILGYTSSEMVGRHISLLFPPETVQDGNILIQKILNGEKVEQLETVRVRKDQTRINVSITLNAISNKAGKVVAVSKILRDITQQKKAELELKQSNKRNQIFIQEAPHAIAMFDKEMRYIAASRKWIIDYKLEGSEIIGRSHYEIFPEIGDDWKKTHQDCLNGAIDQCDEAMFKRADGSALWLTWDVRPWYISEGNVGGLIMYTEDITKNKEKDAEKTRIENILEISNRIARISPFEVDPKTGKAKWNHVGLEIFELPEDFEASHDNLLPFYKEGERLNELKQAIQRSMEQRIPYDLELEIVTAKGNKRWLRIIGDAEFRNDVCTRRFGVIQDITKSKKIEEEIRLVNEELTAILNAGGVSIIGANTEGIITHFNKGAEILLNYSSAEMIGLKTVMFIHDEDEIHERAKELSLLADKPIAGFDVFTQVAKQGDHESGQWTYVRQDGSTFPVQLVVSPITDMQGEIAGYLGVATDISAIKAAENEMKSLLRITTDQNNRLKNFAHIVSHNLRSHSSNIEMILNLLIEEDPSALENDYISMLQISSGNLNETIANLNEVVLINTASEVILTPINLYRTINTATNNLGQLAKQASVTVINNVDEKFYILGLPAYMDSILLNFLSNGIKYRRPGVDSHITFSASLEDSWIKLAIADNGVGIDLKRNGAKLFGMYKTFHGNEDARGIGLFITKNQVEAMGGKIEVESELGIGTTFYVWLPAHEVKNELSFPNFSVIGDSLN